MKPINSNLNLKPEDGCTKISSSCVIWQGPDIPCIELCKGDSITDVVYELAIKLCEIASGVIDLTTLDFKCLVPTGAVEPTTIVQALQLIIDKQCYFEDNCCDEGSGGGGTVLPISLPACLYFTEDGDEITALLPNDYSAYLATKICEIIDEITSINLTITNLQNRVTVLESNTGGGGTGTTISVVSQCASSATPGAVIPIGQAFSAFESKFCQLTTLLGTNAALSTAIGKECAGLDAAAQLTTPANTMSQIAGWVANPTTLSETIVNMWLTICDMRTAVSNCCSNGTLPCIPIPVSNLQITNLTTSGSTITWSAPNTGSVSEAPVSYLVKAYEWNGSSTVGSPILNVTKPFGTNSHTITIVPDPTKNYQIQVIAQYSCDDSTVTTTVGLIALSAMLYCISVEDVIHDEFNAICQGDTYLTKRRKTILTLKDISTGNTVANTIAPFTAVLNYDVDGDCSMFILESITKTFATGVSTVEHIYESQKYVVCGISDPCTPKIKTYNCLGTISTDRAIACAGEIICS